ncbi:hypothetical protein HPC62_00545 [Thermoleptolyngbya sichuanensis A183]|uniref:Uncharacterized protein n=1 Tax=Thermoleptolyngbya sichuanensis A183 TaxID=2737172 RepID=A0A6M8B812_9CYAN|nr:hypothetical protein [Thermoleptolyngbya sichuanensis]QKD80857.1 hypothetical protein HPC62_00545 [Thermoleptolyngbya sichuanensis A183]
MGTTGDRPDQLIPTNGSTQLMAIEAAILGAAQTNPHSAAAIGNQSAINRRSIYDAERISAILAPLGK